MNEDYMIGQRVIHQNVICTVCKPGDHRYADKLWVDNPERGYSHWVDPINVKPLPGGQL